MRYAMYSPFLVALRLWSWPICRSLSHTLSSWSHMKSQTQNDLWTWFKRFQNAILFRMFHLFCASNTCHPGQSPLEWLPCGKTEYWGCPGTVAPKKAEENCDMHKTIGVRPESTAHLGCEIWFDCHHLPTGSSQNTARSSQVEQRLWLRPYSPKSCLDSLLADL